MTRRPSRAPSQRQLRVGEELRHALAMILERGEIRDPDLVGVNLTVTEIRVSPDMHNATVFVVPLGGTIGAILGDDDGAAAPAPVPAPVPAIDAIIKALKRARPFLRHRLSQEVVLRHVPDLGFQADTSFDEASHIDGLLRSARVSRDLAADDDDDDEEEDAADGA